jgi:hypothetical protein
MKRAREYPVAFTFVPTIGKPAFAPPETATASLAMI